MINTLAQRCHLSSTFEDISALATEINNYYSISSITYILGTKLTSELCKRKKLLGENNCGLSFPSQSSSSYLLLENNSKFLLENATNFILTEN